MEATVRGPRHSLAEVLGRGEEELLVGGNRPLPLDGADQAWLVSEGRVEVFAVISHGERRGARIHLATATAGETIFAAAIDSGPGDREPGGALLGVAHPGTRLLRFSFAAFLGAGHEAREDRLLAAAVDGWVAKVSDRLPREEVPAAVSAAGSLGADALADALRRLYRAVVRVVEAEAEAEADEEGRRVLRRFEAERQTLEGVHRELASVLAPGADRPPPSVEAASPLFAACRLVLEHQGAELRLQSEPRPARNRALRLQRICDAAGIRCRRVLLRDEWWRHDNGPVVAFLPPSGEEDGDGELRPVALLPGLARRYELVDTVARTRTAVDREVAATLDREAYELYPALPEGALGRAELVRLALRGRRRDLWLIAAMALGGGLLNLFVPIVVGVVYGRVIPGGERSELLPLMLVLLAAVLGAAAFQITRALSALRVTSRIDGSLQLVVWDRLLRLPTSFFRRFSVGDLADRSLGIDAIRELLLADVTTALLGLLVSTLSFALLFYFSWKLALLAAALTLALAFAAAIFARLQLYHQRFLMQIQGRISSLVFSLIQGIAKLRVSGTEKQAYSRWATLFAEQRKRAFEAQSVAQRQMVLTVVYALVAELSLFALMGFAIREQLEVGRFLAFSAAFGQIQAAGLTILAILPELLSVTPLFERLRPILDEELEVAPGQPDAGELSGGIEVRHVSFRYQPDGPWVLDDVSLHVKRGELIAIVGPSGSGKSTLLRLLLGFELPESGSVLYDGKSLAALHLGSVRSQIGVVLQNSQLIPGDIYSNIVGSSHLDVEAAWEAARMAGIDDDIRAMPMGMHTIIGGGATFSGGQQQRLMIARALVHRPRIVLLDEATSALDNPTQEVIRKNLETLDATRLLIAHRHSTIRHADRIYVLDGGRIVEEGTYDEIVRRGGLFTRLVERQLA